jgi:hypothetical protein
LCVLTQNFGFDETRNNLLKLNTLFCLQKTAEARKNRKSGSDDEFGIEELISGGGGFGMFSYN